MYFYRRRTIVLLHTEGWNAKSIAGYLEVSRQTVHTTVKRWADEQFAGLHDKPSAPHHPARKTTLRAVREPEGARWRRAKSYRSREPILTDADELLDDR